MRSQRPVLIVFGALLALLGLGFLAAGIGLTWAHATQRDADGFYTSPSYSLASDGYAITADEVRFVAHPGDWFPGPGDLTFRVTVTPTDPEQEAFVGLGESTDVAGFLDGVAHDRITHVGVTADDVTFAPVTGTAEPIDPAAADVWVASAEGTGTQTLTVDAAPGDWTVLVMNADLTPGVAVAASAGASSDLLLPIGLGLVVTALVILSGAAALLVVGARGTAPTTSDEAAASPTQGAPYPVRLTGTLDPELSRGLWLVKWLLVIPHVIVLVALWAAFVVLTVVAGFAIVFTGRYPRSIFDFNVGVMRWTWRVTYYAFGVLGTDRYPPFTLAPDPDYPAALDVAYPGELSRGLVLVKWWLLAIPHYVIVGIFTGGIVAWTFDVGAPGGAKAVASTGLVGVLVVVAAIVLLFSGRYPAGLYDLVMGLQRWAYRVMAYATLMTDEYPPFRLDTGGEEPPTSGPLPPPDSGSDGSQHRELAHT